MTVIDVSRIVMRRWYVAAVCLLLVATCAVLAKSPTIYWTQTDLRLVFSGTKPTNSLFQTSDSIIATAGLLVSEYNSANRSPRLSSDDVTIVDAGIRDGVLVRLPNAGGQWATNFNEPRIDVQVSGSDPEAVRSRTTQVIAQISGLLATRQASAGVAATELIRALPSPGAPVVVTAHASRTRGLAAIVVIGLGLTLGLTLLIDQLVTRARHKRLLQRRGAGVRPTPRAPQLSRI